MILRRAIHGNGTLRRGGVAVLATGSLVVGLCLPSAMGAAPTTSGFPGLGTLTPAEAAIAADPMAAPFAAFAPRVKVRQDERYLHVESDGLPDHGMMVGITAWQQQVPLPQPYTGDNAWRIPRHPVPARVPVSIRGRFLRGAIAVAANGIPIFNPQNNRGEVSQEIGELDEWGGHCGRADDYHYHAAPLHLQRVLGKGVPIAYALDGYPIHGLTEPDGSTPTGLDAFHGHSTPTLGYHYHASTRYPYVNGGFHGEVVEAEGQVDPQPRAHPVRPALQQLRGATITGFQGTPDRRTFDLQYVVNSRPGTIHYALGPDGRWAFRFVDADGSVREETFAPGERRGGGGGGGGGRGGGGGARGERRAAAEPARRQGVQAEETAPVARASANGSFVLSSPVVAEGGSLPVEFTGDGAGVTPPLAWSGAPSATRAYAVILDHVDPEGRTKWYWTLYNLPASVTTLPRDVRGLGTQGNNSINGRVGYAPPHSKGPGPKKYVFTAYALSSPLELPQPPADVGREVLLAAMKDRLLASATLSVVYSRGGDGPAEEGGRPRGGEATGRPPRDRRPAGGGGRGDAGGRASSADGRSPTRKPDASGLVKPTLADTVRVNVYADNWFVLYVNGRLCAVDPIEFTPHNVVSFDILPEYPMTLAVLAKDNADPKTGLEYGDHIGDGGFILKFADGTVTDAHWKARSFFTGPLGRDLRNPRVAHLPIPADWFSVDFDDSRWESAVEYTEERVNPKEAFHAADFTGARFIWTRDLDLDNTVIFRTRIEKPGWTPRWNTHPDLRVGPAPAY